MDAKVYQYNFSTVQSRCLLDHGNSAGQLDHSAEGILPGERFDADQQCKFRQSVYPKQKGSITCMVFPRSYIMDFQ